MHGFWSCLDMLHRPKGAVIPDHVSRGLPRSVVSVASWFTGPRRNHSRSYQPSAGIYPVRPSGGQHII